MLYTLLMLINSFLSIFQKNVFLDKREKRFLKYSENVNFALPLPLLLENSIDKSDLSKIKAAIFILIEKYIVSELNGNVIKPISDNINQNMYLFKKASGKLVGNCIENTLNTQEEYNNLQKIFSNAFNKTGIGKYIDEIQYPINLRIKAGDYNSKQEHSDNKLTTSKAHIDIWAGAPSNLAICISEIMNIDNGAKIEFNRMRHFPKKLAKRLEMGYDDPLARNFIKDHTVKKVISKTGFYNIVDSFTPHQTVYNGNGLRISIDFRFSWKKKFISELGIKLPGDFVPYKNWIK